MKKKKHKIQLLLLGLNIHIQEAYIKSENDLLNNGERKGRNRRLNKVKKKWLTVDNTEGERVFVNSR